MYSLSFIFAIINYLHKKGDALSINKIQMVVNLSKHLTKNSYCHNDINIAFLMQCLVGHLLWVSQSTIQSENEKIELLVSVEKRPSWVRH